MSFVPAGAGVPVLHESLPLSNLYPAAAKFIAEVIRLGSREECHVLARQLGGTWHVEVRTPCGRSDSLLLPSETLEAAASPATANVARREILDSLLAECRSLFGPFDEANLIQVKCDGARGCDARFPFLVSEILKPPAPVNCPVCGNTVP